MIFYLILKQTGINQKPWQVFSIICAVESCIDLLSGREDVDVARIGVIGHLLGGHNAMFLGAFDHRLKVIVSSCGWTQLEYYEVGKKAHERYGGRLGPLGARTVYAFIQR